MFIKNFFIIMMDVDNKLGRGYEGALQKVGSGKSVCKVKSTKGEHFL